eukprot:g1313.t1
MPEETREQTEVPEGQRAFALSPERTECYAEPVEEWDPFQQMNGIRRKKNELLRNPSAFSLDLSPRLLYGRSEHVDVLIESGVARYLEFQGLKFTRVLTSEGLISVPLTKSEIFQDAHLSKAEKRMLMRFITSIQPYVSSLAFQSAAQLGVDQAAKIKGPSDQSALGMELDGSWRAYRRIARGNGPRNLSERLQDFITYSICLWDWAPTEAFPQLSCREALERLGAFISSLGLYVQEEDGTMQLSGLVTCRGEQIKASRLVAACGELLQDQVPSQSSSQHCRRMTVLLSSPPLGEEGVSLCVVPPQSLDPPLQNVVQVLQLDFSSGACPHGYFLAHLSQASISDPGPLPFADLDRVLEELLKRSPKTACIFRCRYLQRPRDVATRWDVSTRTGGFMERCLHEERLAVVSDPPAVPQLLAVQEVHDARRIFGSFFGAESAFLPKPQHRFMRARDLRVTWEEVDLGLNPVLYFALPLVMLWKPLPSFYLLLLFYLLRPAWQRSNPRRSSTQGSRDSRDIMNYSIAGLVAELGDLRQATTFELQGLQVTDALELDAVAQLPDNALFKYRLKTGLFVGDLDGSQCLLWDDPAIQVKPMLLPDFWAPIGGFAGRRLPARLRLRRLEVQDGRIRRQRGIRMPGTSFL